MDSQLDDNRVWVRLAIVALVRFFDEAPGTTKAHLTLDEVGRIGITTLVAAGGLFGILEIVRWTSGSTFPGSRRCRDGLRGVNLNVGDTPPVESREG